MAPEGTRKLTPGWKTGFYYIAWQAKVKEGGILPEVLIPTGDIEKDFEMLRRNYGPLTARYPKWKAPVVPLRNGRDDSQSQAAEAGW